MIIEKVKTSHFI